MYISDRFNVDDRTIEQQIKQTVDTVEVMLKKVFSDDKKFRNTMTKWFIQPMPIFINELDLKKGYLNGINWLLRAITDQD
jgi:hypothetical protein